MKKIILFLVFLLYPLLVSAQPSTTSIIAVSDDDVTVYTNHIGFIGADVNKAGYKAIVNIQSSSDTRYLKLDGSSTTTASIPFAEGLSVGDANTTLTKDGSNNMLFTDAVSGSKTLAQLLDPEADMYWWDGDSWEPWDKTVTEASASDIKTALQTIDNMISGNEAQVDVVTLPAINTATVSAVNSSTATLSGQGVFTGAAEQVDAYGMINVSVIASQSGTISFQFSSDGTNWDITYAHSVGAGATGARVFNFLPLAQYFRIVYTNGAASLSYFRLETRYYPLSTFQTLPLDYGLALANNALTTHSVMAAKVAQTVTTGIGEGLVADLRTDQYRNLSVVTPSGSGNSSPVQIATEGTLSAAVAPPNFVSPNNYAIGIKGVAYTYDNNYTAPFRAQQDMVQEFTITADGIYDINQTITDYQYSDINYVKVSGYNTHATDIVKINCYYFSENLTNLLQQETYRLFFSTIISNTPAGYPIATVNDGMAFTIPITAYYYKDPDNRFGYIEVTSTSTNFADEIKIEIGHTPWYFPQ